MQFALDRVLSVAGSYAATNTKKGIKEGDIALLLNQITEPSLSFTSETEDIVDARNNVVMVLENGRGATFGAANAFFNTGLLAAQVGGKVEEGKTISFTKYDIIQCKEVKTEGAAGIFELSFTPVGDIVVYALANDGSLLSAAPIDAAGYTSVEGTPYKLEIAGKKVGEQILVVYDTELTSNEHIVALADATNELLDVTAEVLLRELCKEELYYAYICFRGKLNGEAEWGMTRDGNHGFEFRCFPEYCGDKSLVDIIIVKG